MRPKIDVDDDVWSRLDADATRQENTIRHQVIYRLRKVINDLDDMDEIPDLPDANTPSEHRVDVPNMLWADVKQARSQFEHDDTLSGFAGRMIKLSYELEDDPDESAEDTLDPDV